MVSDVRYALAELNKVVEVPDIAAWREQVAEWKGADPFQYDDDFDGILPQQAIRALSELTRDRKTIVSVGVFEGS